jgi:hypothetical protein
MFVHTLLHIFCFESDVSLQNVLFELCPDGCGIAVNMVVKGKEE